MFSPGKRTLKMRLVVVVSTKPQVPDYISLYRIFHIYIDARCDIFYVVIQKEIQMCFVWMMYL